MAALKELNSQLFASLRTRIATMQNNEPASRIQVVPHSDKSRAFTLLSIQLDQFGVIWLNGFLGAKKDEGHAVSVPWTMRDYQFEAAVLTGGPIKVTFEQVGA
ncbi:hypothetical protein MNJPNG_14095 [Cupriavidus oxalaticus]|uniref:hypothetical protein n=1 Tax=Cupriavidus oxalaticus TaxID=96344 RepID=UPI003F740E50